MADWGDRFIKAVGIGQGVEWLAKVGGGTLVSFVVGGALAALSSLPPWAIAGAMVGVFLLVVAAIAELLRRFARASPLTPIIEHGFALRERLHADPEPDPDLAYVTLWKTRIDDWVDEARLAIGSIAPNRVGPFMIDLLVVNSPDTGIPGWKQDLLLDFDLRIERLILVRASL